MNVLSPETANGRPLIRESREQFSFPAQYMFKDVPTTRRADDYVGIALDEIGRHLHVAAESLP